MHFAGTNFRKYKIFRGTNFRKNGQNSRNLRKFVPAEVRTIKVTQAHVMEKRLMMKYRFAARRTFFNQKLIFGKDFPQIGPKFDLKIGFLRLIFELSNKSKTKSKIHVLYILTITVHINKQFKTSFTRFLVLILPPPRFV